MELVEALSEEHHRAGDSRIEPDFLHDSMSAGSTSLLAVEQDARHAVFLHSGYPGRDFVLLKIDVAHFGTWGSSEKLCKA